MKTKLPPTEPGFRSPSSTTATSNSTYPVRAVGIGFIPLLPIWLGGWGIFKNDFPEWAFSDFLISYSPGIGWHNEKARSEMVLPFFFLLHFVFCYFPKFPGT
jgi:hypothetical protein